ncbi:MAG TPA: S8 family serine peptidase [Saprospiraceae bacterium]|nr:S8 family serine peptidase [Saprospiraceae bacterium]
MSNTQIKVILYFLCLLSFRNTKAEPVSTTPYSIQDTSEFEYFVVFEEGTPTDTLSAYLSDLNSEQIWSPDDSNIALWKVKSFPFTPPNSQVITNISEVIRASKAKTKISGTAFNTEVSIDSIALDTASTCFDLPQLSMVQGNNQIKISILDTGLSNISNNSNATYNYNLTSANGFDYVRNDNEPDDENGHGSHIAGIIHSIVKAASPNTEKVVFDIRKTHDSQGQAKLSNVVIAFYDALEDEADIINLSFGISDTLTTDRLYPIQFMINEAKERGVLVVAAGGNFGEDNDNSFNTFLPASHMDNNIISVAAIDCNESLSFFSNYGKSSVDLTIYGRNIPGPDMGTGIVYKSGTSQATAIVTATAALLGTHMNQFDPIILKCALINGAVKVPALEEKVISGGIIDVSNSFSLINSINPTFMVTDTADFTSGSLRFAIESKCGVNQIQFSPSISGKTLIIENRELRIDSNLSIIGGGINATKIFSNGPHNTLYLGSSAEVLLSNLSLIKNASAPANIINKGNLTVENVTIK